MPDTERVIKGLEWILEDDRFGFGVNWRTGEPRDEYEKAGKIITDTITLLKEQVEEIEHLERPDCEHAEHDSVGCLGYYGCTQDDEPIEACKSCEKYTGNIAEATKWE